MDQNRIDAVCEGTSYARRAAQDAQFSFGQANMFANAYNEGNTGLHSSIAERVAEGRRHLEAALRQCDAAERALSPLGETRREYLHRTTVNLTVVDSIPQQPRIQGAFDEGAQLRVMEAIGLRFGLKDAVVWLRRRREGREAHNPARSTTNIQIGDLPEGFGAIPQQEQCQSATEDQIDALELIADRYGLWLAAISIRERPRPALRVA